MTRGSPTPATARRVGRALVVVAAAGLALAGCQSAGAGAGTDTDAGAGAQVSQVESQLDAIQRALDDVPG
ncbi:hypothetical protein [Pseudonocardia xishanensis]|uniref:Uncharacterized protein n=1 Tax=Pseudonocardia xishanensis TaxID=630995 RepID=A0ABP8RRM0_9PSEU